MVLQVMQASANEVISWCKCACPSVHVKEKDMPQSICCGPDQLPTPHYVASIAGILLIAVG